MKLLSTTIGAHQRERDSALGRKLVPRLMSAALSKALSSPLVKVVTGPRRAGKSTLVFMELVRRGFKPNLDLFYYQTRSGIEVDFLLRQGSRNLELIQVAQNLSALKTRERELRALTQAAEELNVSRLTIVTMDSEETIKEGKAKIRVVRCRSWLQEQTK